MSKGNKKIYKVVVIEFVGVAFGLDDKRNEYTYVAHDDSLQEVSEEYLLSEPLSENKTFIAHPARLFVRNNSIV